MKGCWLLEETGVRHEEDGHNGATHEVMCGRVGCVLMASRGLYLGIKFRAGQRVVLGLRVSPNTYKHRCFRISPVILCACGGEFPSMASTVDSNSAVQLDQRRVVVLHRSSSGHNPPFSHVGETRLHNQSGILTLSG